MESVRERSRCWGTIYCLKFFAGIVLCGLTASAEDDPTRPSAPARLKFVQQVLNGIKIEPTDKADTRNPKIQLAPLLRYNDVQRNIADSMVFRLGSQGRPIAFVTCELYGGSGRQFILNHEFLAIQDPRLRLHRDEFVWAPPDGTKIEFKNLDSDVKPTTTARVRLAQLKTQAERFSAHETWQGSRIELRILPTPIDRYVPSEKPNSDAAVFAFVQGVNPEALLLLETDGKTWTYAWARLGVAKLEAQLDDVQVWQVPLGAPDNSAEAGYTSIHRNVEIPEGLEAETKTDPTVEKPAAGEKPK